MAIGLDDALLGRFVESAGERLANWLPDNPAREAILYVVRAVVEETVDEW